MHCWFRGESASSRRYVRCRPSFIWRMSRPVWNLSDGPELLSQAATSLSAL
jgi:hypothetical protein